MSSRSRYWRHVQPQVTPQTGVMVCASGRQGCRLASKTRPDQPPKGTKGSAQPTQNAARRSATAGLFVSAPIRQSAKSNPQFTNPHQPGITSSPHDSDAPGCLFSRSTVAAPRSLPAHTLQNICCPRGLTHSRLTELAPCCAAPLTWLFSVRDFDPSSKWLGLGRQTPNRSRTKRKLLELGPSDCLRPTPASANAKPFVGSAPHVLCAALSCLLHSTCQWTLLASRPYLPHLREGAYTRLPPTPTCDARHLYAPLRDGRIKNTPYRFIDVVESCCVRDPNPIYLLCILSWPSPPLFETGLTASTRSRPGAKPEA
jgi:hypothetical protein